MIAFTKTFTFKLIYPLHCSELEGHNAFFPSRFPTSKSVLINTNYASSTIKNINRHFINYSKNNSGTIVLMKGVWASCQVSRQTDIGRDGTSATPNKAQLCNQLPRTSSQYFHSYCKCVRVFTRSFAFVYVKQYSHRLQKEIHNISININT